MEIIETQCLPASEESIRLGAQLLREGKLVGMPTETVYGLAANALDEAAVRSVFAAKGRPADNPLIVHVARKEDCEKYCEVSPMAHRLMDAFWPGPLTILMPKKPIIPDIVTAGLPTVAMRMPSHPVANALIAESGCPIAAPSGNTSGKPSPTRAWHMLDDMRGKIPLILDGGPCEVGVESTVININCPVPVVLRPGGITPEMLLTVLDEVQVADSVLRPLKEGEVALSPGMRYKHYAPNAALTLVRGDSERVIAACKALYDQAEKAGKKACILSFTEHLADYAPRVTCDIGPAGQEEEVARRVFDVLRVMDRDGMEVLFSEIVPPEGVGLAIMNRMGRAAAFHVIDAE